MDLEQRFRVPEKGFALDDCDPADTAGLGEAEAEAQREKDLERLADLQERLYAEGARSLLVVLQARDAAGKDGTIAHVMRGLNPQGVTVTSFKQPTSAELAHDYLWRTTLALPVRGDIGVFNRSHYEDVLVVRVHDDQGRDDEFWDHRLKDIRRWERHLVREGTRVVKFFLNVSRDEQKARFLARAEEADKNWKFSAGDVAERERWDDYQHAYQEALAATSTEHAPWYVIPADHKWMMRTAVASIIADHLEDMDPQVPELSAEERTAMDEAVAKLKAE